jgi:hypothetical protein
VCWWLSVSLVCHRFRPKAKAREPLASLLPLRPQDVRHRQLQHRRALSLAQAREEHYIGEFQRIVMGHGVVHVNLPEAREPLPDLLVWQNTDAKRRLAFDILRKRNLSARQQADRNMRLADGGETASDGITKLGRDQRVLGPGGPSRDMVQTIVTHRPGLLFLCKAGMVVSLNEPPQGVIRLAYRHHITQESPR